MENYFTHKNIIPKLKEIGQNPGMYYLGHLGIQPEMLHVEITGWKDGGFSGQTLTGRFGRNLGGVPFACFHEGYPLYVIDKTEEGVRRQMKDALSFRVEVNEQAVKSNLEAKNKWLGMRSTIDTLGVSKGWTLEAANANRS